MEILAFNLSLVTQFCFVINPFITAFEVISRLDNYVIISLCHFLPLLFWCESDNVITMLSILTQTHTHLHLQRKT